jgi:HTH-type transcriptional regulator / antitoxin HigA
MGNKTLQNQYQPDFVTPPGETLKEILEFTGMTQAELAERAGRPKKTINEIIKGRAAITPETALQLGRVLGVSADFWNSRETQYRESLARQADNGELRNQLNWVNQFPVKAMMQRGWITQREDPLDQLKELLAFFGINRPSQWEKVCGATSTSFRQSHKYESDRYAMASWLRRGEIKAQAIVCQPYDAGKFQTALKKVRRLTVADPSVFQPNTVALCASAGVAVVFVPELEKIRACGAARWQNTQKAILQVNLRYKTDDQLWFSFFHEAAHILKHGKRDVFIDVENADSNQQEEEANQFAADTLISPDEMDYFLSKVKTIQDTDIIRFAGKIGIAPGIVVGRLQHDRMLPITRGNKLKRHLQWSPTDD